MGPSESQGNVEGVPSPPWIATEALIDDFLIYKGGIEPEESSQGRKSFGEAMQRFTRRGQQCTAIVSGLPQRLRASLQRVPEGALATLLWGEGVVSKWTYAAQLR